jgi:Mannosyltransferase (PIG-V)
MSKTPGEISILRVALGLCLWKILLLAILVVALRIAPDLDGANFAQMSRRHPPAGPPVFATHFATWDTAHYIHLAEAGFRHDDPSCAFYPLWPAVIRLGSLFTGGNLVVSACVFANLLAVAGQLLFWCNVRDLRGGAAASWALLFLLLFPGSVFYHAGYSEPLFFALLMVLWRGLSISKPAWIFTSALLLPWTRAVGVFAVVPLGASALATVVAHRCCSPKGLLERVANFGAPLKVTPATVLTMVATPVFGWGLYLAFMGCSTGDPFEGFHAQRHWGVHSIGNLVNLPRFVVRYFQPSEWHAFAGSTVDRAAFGLLLSLSPLILRTDRRFIPWVYMLAIVPAMSGSFTSFIRYESTVFPLFAALGAVFASDSKVHSPGIRAPGRPWTGLLLAGAFAGGHAVLLWRLANYRWAG